MPSMELLPSTFHQRNLMLLSGNKITTYNSRNIYLLQSHLYSESSVSCCVPILRPSSFEALLSVNALGRSDCAPLSVVWQERLELAGSPADPNTGFRSMALMVPWPFLEAISLCGLKVCKHRLFTPAGASSPHHIHEQVLQNCTLTSFRHIFLG